MRENTRAMAIDILCRWEEMGEPVEQGLESRAALVPDHRDRQLLHSLVFGVIRWRGYLDWVLTRFSTHPLEKMKCFTRQALYVGLFQLFFLDRVPASAAINETVQALKVSRQPRWLTGFVNGVLRAAARQRQILPSPSRNPEALPLAARLSHPQWLLDRWLARYGTEKTISICEANNRPPVLCLRVNTRKLAVEEFLELCRQAGVSAEPGLYAPAAVRLPDYRGPIATVPGFPEGCFQVQDEAAQLVSLLAAPFAPGDYLDACAGLGGKTAHLAELIPAAARLTAVEPNDRRYRLLQDNLARLALAGRVTLVHGELRHVEPASGRQFRGILLDAPCSGIGVIRRHPDIRWNRGLEDLGRYAATQLELLEEAASLLAPGGVLVYATCSTEPEENEQVVERFLAGHGDFALTDGRDFLPLAASSLTDARGCLRTLPDDPGVDGFFAARLVKNEE